MGEYIALKQAGHSPAKAAEILLDARRGCDYARKWVSLATGGTATHPVNAYRAGRLIVKDEAHDR